AISCSRYRATSFWKSSVRAYGSRHAQQLCHLGLGEAEEVEDVAVFGRGHFPSTWATQKLRIRKSCAKPVNVEAERPGRLEVEDQFESARLHHGQLGRFFALEYAAGIHADLTIC